MKNLYKILFLNTMMIGTILAISSMSWFICWLGLEINLLSLMPLMKTFKNKYSAEAAIKYFIVQAMASAILLFSVILFTSTKNYDIKMNFLSYLFMDSALLMKLGAAPLHFWFPEIISGLNWEIAFIMLTWQKIAPMILISYTMQMPIFMSMIVIISSLVSGLQGLNQTCMRKIMAYSSINHVSWMIAAMMNSMTIWLYYFIIYTIINFNIIWFMNKFNIYFINQMNKLLTNNKKMKLFLLSNFLNLGGIPPFLGFLPKWLTINNLINNNFYMLSVTLIIFTLISLYFYLRLIFPTLMMNSKESPMKILLNFNFMFMLMNLLSVSSLLICTIMTNIF